MPVCVIMLVETARDSFGWQPALPQVSDATRKSPGFTNFTYSADSPSHFAKTLFGRAPESRKPGSRGCTWALSFAARYPDEFCAVPGAIPAEEFPPWQSVQPSCTVFVGCMVGSSIGEWQVMQPADLRSASLLDWPMLICGVAENPRKLLTSSAADEHKDKTINQPGLPAHFFAFARGSS